MIKIRCVVERITYLSPETGYSVLKCALKGYDALFKRLGASDFRSKFKLGEKELSIIREKGMDTIRSHAKDFVTNRLAPADLPNDGKQTPMRGHPVFIAQHATACCCRGSLHKYGIRLRQVMP